MCKGNACLEGFPQNGVSNSVCVGSRSLRKAFRTGPRTVNTVDLADSSDAATKIAKIPAWDN
jgi:hypothetical protein